MCDGDLAQIRRTTQMVPATPPNRLHRLAVRFCGLYPWRAWDPLFLPG